MESEIITKFEKNSLEEVRGQFTEFKGHNLVDLRVYVQGQGQGKDKVPTKKGLCLSIDLLPDLEKAVLELKKKAIERGLLGCNVLESGEN